MIIKVKEWLETQGFTLEIRTASAFRKAGFEVRQSSLYIDPETGKPREIDVLAKDPDHIGVTDIQFIVECKSSKKPWVIFSSPDTPVGYNRLFAFAAMSKPAINVLADRDQFAERLERLPWLRKDGYAGYFHSASTF